jgi:hypothetical protein
MFMGFLPQMPFSIRLATSTDSCDIVIAEKEEEERCAFREIGPILFENPFFLRNFLQPAVDSRAFSWIRQEQTSN